MFGWFDSDYEYHTFASVTSLIADEDKKDTINTFVYEAIKDSNSSISDGAVAAMVVGFPAIADKYFRYGKNHYHFGLPSGAFTSYVLNKNIILDVIGHDKIITKSYVNLSSSMIAIIGALRQQEWWDINNADMLLPDTLYEGYTGIVNSPLGFDILFESVTTLKVRFNLDWSNIVIEDFLPDSQDSKYWDTQAQVFDEELYNSDYAAWEIAGSIPPAPDLTDPKYWIQPADVFNSALYNADYAAGEAEFANVVDNAPKQYIVSVANPSENDNPNPGLWVIYQDSLGNTYDILDYYPSATFPYNPAIAESNEYMPVSVFIQNNVNYNAVSNWKDTLKKLVKQLNLDADKILDEFYTSLNQDPVDDLELLDFFIYFGVPLHISNYGEKRDGVAQYTFKLMEKFHSISEYSLTDYLNYLEELAEYNSVENDYLGENYNPGGVPIYLLRGDPKPEPPSSGVSIGLGAVFNASVKWYFIEKASSSISFEDAIGNLETPSLSVNYKLYQGINYGLGTSKEYVVYAVAGLSTYFSVDTPDGNKGVYGEGLYIPLNYTVLNELDFRSQEEVLQDSLKAVVFSVIEEEIKWYQQGFWQAIIVIVTVVIVVAITVFTAGSGTAGGLAGLSAVIAGATGIGVTLVSLTIKAAVGFLVSMSTQIVFGDSIVGQVVAIAVMVVVGSPGGLSGLSTSASAAFSAPGATLQGIFQGTAGEVLGSVSKILNTGYSLYNNLTTSDSLEISYTNTELDKQEELENKSLGMGSNIDGTLSITRSIFIPPTETYDQFMGRSLNTSPNDVAMAYVETYVDYALRLPKTPAEVMQINKPSR